MAFTNDIRDRVQRRDHLRDAIEERRRVWNLQDQISRAVFEKKSPFEIDRLLERLREATTNRRSH